MQAKMQKGFCSKDIYVETPERQKPVHIHISFECDIFLLKVTFLISFCTPWFILRLSTQVKQPSNLPDNISRLQKHFSSKRRTKQVFLFIFLGVKQETPLG